MIRVTRRLCAKYLQVFVNTKGGFKKKNEGNSFGAELKATLLLADILPNTG